MYTKEQQLYKNKVKKKSTFGKKKYRIRKKSLKKVITKEELDYLKWLQTKTDAVCFVCGKRDPGDDIEWHHVKYKSTDKKNHFRLIPLCGAKHHRLGFLSPHANPKVWRETFTLKQQIDYAKSIYEDYKKEKGLK